MKRKVNFASTFVFQEMFATIKNLVAADRDGNWNLHVQAVRSAMPIFRSFDAVNYLRYASFYLEKIQVLEITHPTLYDRFNQGYFVVRDNPSVYFSSVAGDLKLEQSINRFSKGQGGYVLAGASGDVSSVSEFELLFHEIIQISNLIDETIGMKTMGHLETSIQHSLSGSGGIKFNKNVTQLLDVVSAQGNPYDGAVQLALHNIMTKTVVSERNREGILSVLKIGEREYLSFRTERYVVKSKKITAKISKIKTATFTSANIEKGKALNEKEDVSNKDIAIAQRKMDVASMRGMSIEEILSHDLLD